MYGSNTKITEMLRAVTKKTKSPVAMELMKDHDFEDACSLAYQLYSEMMEEFKEGEMTWKEAIDDLYENLKAIDMPMPPEVEEENGEEEDGE